MTMKKITLFAAAMLCGALTVTAQNTESGHEYVDLGLPSGLKWATCNVGATAPEAYGDYYAWGETETKTNYTWSNYKFTTDGGTTFTKYNTESSRGTVDNKTTLDPEDDAAAVNWGGKWRMPTDDEWTELRNNCTWTGVEGIPGTDTAGYILTSKINGNSIFLPAAGCRIYDYLGRAGSSGYYWSSSLNAGSPYVAWGVNVSSDDVSRDGYGRCYGQSVRPVCEVTTPTALAAAEMPAVYAADGRIVCAQEFRVFDLLGRDVTRQNGTLYGVYVVKTADAAQKVVVK